MNFLDSDCLDPLGSFYFDIYILSNGKVTKWTLMQKIENEYCAIAEVDAWNIPRWIPAEKNGTQCNQLLKIKTNIHFE